MSAGLVSTVGRRRHAPIMKNLSRKPRSAAGRPLNPPPYSYPPKPASERHSSVRPSSAASPSQPRTAWPLAPHPASQCCSRHRPETRRRQNLLVRARIILVRRIDVDQARSDTQPAQQHPGGARPQPQRYDAVPHAAANDTTQKPLIQQRHPEPLRHQAAKAQVAVPKARHRSTTSPSPECVRRTTARTTGY